MSASRSGAFQSLAVRPSTTAVSLPRSGCRIISAPHDTGLACLLLGIRDSEQLFVHPLRGALFENYVMGEVAKAFFNHRLAPPIFFWRDQGGHEIDLLIEDGDLLCPVETKSAGTVAGDMFTGLKWWARLAGKSSGPPTLVYGGTESYVRGG